MRYGDNQSLIMRAVAAQNRGQHREAAGPFQKAGNLERPLAEKQELWDAADRARRVADSD